MKGKCRKITVVTVVWNDLEGIKRTLASVIGQTYQNIEYIVVDGASIDGTAEFLFARKNSISALVSEPDSGLYDAMNKGTALATGDWVIYLNAGDTFTSDTTLTDTAEFFVHDNIVYFGRANIRLSEKHGWLYPPTCVDERTFSYWLGKNLPNHQAMFFPRSFYTENRYRSDLRISADSDFKERAIAAVNVGFIDLVVCRFFLDGLSSQRTLKLQMVQARDRFNRLTSPRKYIDYPISVTKGLIRATSYRLMGEMSHVAIHRVKTTFDCGRLTLRAWIGR